MKNKKYLAGALAAITVMGSLTGCGKIHQISEATTAITVTENGPVDVVRSYREKYEASKTFDFFTGSYTNSGSKGVVYDYVCEEAECVESTTTASVDMSGSESYSTNNTDIYPIIIDDYNTSEYSAIKENGFTSVRTSPLSTFSADVDTASYSNIRSYLDRGISEIPEGAVRIEEMINYFKYDYKKAPIDGNKFNVYTEYSTCPWNSDTRLMMVGINTADIDFSEKAPSNLVFLIDTSGSMFNDNKLPLAQKAFDMLAENLDENDRISIVTYAGTESVVLTGVKGSETEVITGAIDSLEAYGSTNGGAGIISAYELAEEYYIKGGNNRVILATDGDLNVGITSQSDLVDLIKEEKSKNNIAISVLGFGNYNLKDNKLEALADNGDGNYAFIDSVAEAKKVLVEDMGGTLFTVAKDVKFQVEFNPAYIKGYRLIGYEDRALNAEDFNNDKIDAGELGAGHMVTAIYEVVPTDSKLEIGTSELKYSDNDSIVACSDSDEIATVNIRYKEPEADTSKLESTVVKASDYSEKMSSDLSFAAGVSAFGMILRNSELKGSADKSMVLSLAAVKADAAGAASKEAEFVQLVMKF